MTLLNLFQECYAFHPWWFFGVTLCDDLSADDVHNHCSSPTSSSREPALTTPCVSWGCMEYQLLPSKKLPGPPSWLGYCTLPLHGGALRMPREHRSFRTANCKDRAPTPWGSTQGWDLGDGCRKPFAIRSQPVPLPCLYASFPSRYY